MGKESLAPITPEGEKAWILKPQGAVAQWPLLQPLPVSAQKASPLQREQMVDATSLAPSIRPLPTPNASQGPVTRVSSGLSDAKQGIGTLFPPNYFEGSWIAAWAQKAWAGLDLRGLGSHRPGQRPDKRPIGSAGGGHRGGLQLFGEEGKSSPCHKHGQCRAGCSGPR